MTEMSADEQTELREIWQLFSELSCRARQVNDDTIATAELPTLLKALGQHPSDQDLPALYQQADPTSCGVIYFQNFQAMAGGLIQNREQEITEAFRVFDKEGKGKCHTSEFRHVMTNLGEKFHNDEVDEMIREAGVKGQDGHINYEEFAKKLSAT
eukprot:TRINITY_DN7683_c0_g1_i1.p1 TRINITY_DN7683_c0_g1~~TRINITY_DN7683_c0_g1_i1.p1  ORF type:complete len:155 (+),score=38.42 TRINITY_DN7683_c0_g1_i1:72-536(+)